MGAREQGGGAMIMALLLAATIGASQTEVPDTLIDDFKTASFPLNGWTHLTSDDTAIVFYLHPIRRQAGLPRISTRLEFTRPQSSPAGRYLSLRQVQEMDCVSGLSHRLEHTAHRARNLEGPVVGEDEPDQPWVAPVPGTLDEAIFRKACAPLE